MKQIIEVELDVPEGYTAVYRIPKHGERFITNRGYLDKAEFVWTSTHVFVLEPVVTWRDATVEDACRAIRGETVKARFGYKGTTGWTTSRLVGYSHGYSRPWIADNDSAYQKCQVATQAPQEPL